MLHDCSNHFVGALSDGSNTVFVVVVAVAVVVFAVVVVAVAVVVGGGVVVVSVEMTIKCIHDQVMAGDRVFAIPTRRPLTFELCVFRTCLLLSWVLLLSLLSSLWSRMFCNYCQPFPTH